MKPLLVILLLILSLATPLSAQQKANKVVIDKAITALRQKDLTSLQLCMAKEYTIAGLDAKTSAAVLAQLVRGFADFSGYTIEKEIMESGQNRVYVVLNYTNGKLGHPDLVLNDQDQIIELNIIKSPKIKPPVANTLPVQVNLPFRLFNGCIYVEGSVNGTKGLFMIDSGAFGLVMNKGMFPLAMDTVNYGKEISGVNGQAAEAAGVKVQDLSFAGVTLHGLTAIAMPMEPEIADTGLPNLGLIGYALLSKYSLTFDYAKRVLQLNIVDSLGNDAVGDPTALIGKLSFDMQRHLPIISATINKKHYRFALDCGASHNLIYREFDQEWEGLVSDIASNNLSGIDGKVSAVTTGLLRQMEVGNVVLAKLATAFTPNNLYTQSAAAALKIDGIMGYPFFNAYKLKINYQKKELSFFKNN